MCDFDMNCKGYVQREDSCETATVSTCQSQCKKYDKGNIGNLVTHRNRFDNSDYERCFIKRFGNFCISIKNRYLLPP